MQGLTNHVVILVDSRRPAWYRGSAYDCHMSDRDVPILLWPFYAIWRLLTFVLEVVGRLLCALIGIALMAAGTAITITVLAAPIGIPIAAVGFLLVVRAIF